MLGYAISGTRAQVGKGRGVENRFFREVTKGVLTGGIDGKGRGAKIGKLPWHCKVNGSRFWQ